MPTVSFTTSGALRKAALRHANERLVLDSIRRSPGISRAEIARRTGSPRTSVTFVVDRLLKARLICEEKGDRIATSAGRPPTALHLRAAARLAVGVEIARPLTRVVLVDLQGNILERRTIHWHEHAGHLLEDVHQAIRAVASVLGIRARGRRATCSGKGRGRSPSGGGSFGARGAPESAA